MVESLLNLYLSDGLEVYPSELVYLNCIVEL